MNSGAPLLNTHSDWSLEDVIGSVVPGSARISGGRGLATVKLSSAAGDADTVIKIKTGIVRNISVGYVVHRVEIIERDRDVPIWRVVDWEPIEISAVPIPADPGAQVRGNRSSEIEGSLVSVTTLEKYSIPAIRARMLADHRRLGLIPEIGEFQ
jgi:hypothetical protein